MSSKIEQVIDEIEEYLDGCKFVPFSSSNISVDKEEIEELIAEKEEIQADDSDVKPNEKVIPSMVNEEEYFKPHSRNGVAAIFGINPESIRTAHNNAIKKLRHPGSLRIIKGEVVENELFIRGFGYIRKEHLKYPAYLYIKHDAHFKELVTELEKMGIKY